MTINPDGRRYSEGVTPTGSGCQPPASAAEEASSQSGIPNAASCPHCGEILQAEMVAYLPDQTDLTLAFQVAEGQMIQAKTLAGVVDQFDKMQRAIGKEIGCKTTTLIKSLETDGDELRITFRICNQASGTLPRENTEECSRAKPSGPTGEAGDAQRHD